MKKFAFFEHTADVLFEAYGASFKQAIENSASVLLNVMAKTRFVKKTVRKVFRQKAGSREELVVFLLNDLLSESDAREVFWKEFKVRKLTAAAGGTGFSVEGVAYGSAFERKAGGQSVKAVTMHEASVTAPAKGKEKGTEKGTEKGKWTVRILLDV